MTEQDKIIERIRKMAAMMSSSNEGEAAAFAERVQSELLKHNLTMMDVEKRTVADDQILMDSSTETSSEPWRRNLGNATAKMYLCAYFFAGGVRPNGKTKFDQHCFVGTASNVAVAKLMFTYLHETVDRLARAGALKLPEKRRSPYRVDFRRACVKRLGQRIWRRIEDAKKGGVLPRIDAKPGETENLPALLPMFEKAEKQNAEFIEKEVGELTVPDRKQKPLDPLGMIEGLEAGDKIGLDIQVANDKLRRIGSA